MCSLVTLYCGSLKRNWLFWKVACVYLSGKSLNIVLLACWAGAPSWPSGVSFVRLPVPGSGGFSAGYIWLAIDVKPLFYSMIDLFETGSM